MEEVLLDLIVREGEREKAEIAAEARKRADAIVAEATARAKEIEGSGPPVVARFAGDKGWVEKNSELAGVFDETLERIRRSALAILFALPREERLRLLFSFWEEGWSGLPDGEYFVTGPPEAALPSIPLGTFTFSINPGVEEEIRIVSDDGARQVYWSLESIVKRWFESERGRIVEMILEEKVAS